MQGSYVIVGKITQGSNLITKKKIKVFALVFQVEDLQCVLGAVDWVKSQLYYRAEARTKSLSDG